MAGGMIFTFFHGFYSAISLFIMTVEIYPFVSNMMMFKSCSSIEINPFVSNIIMFKSRVFIVEYVCSITGAVIFTFYQGLTSGLKFRTLQLGQSFPAAN
ncbi:hypothetical protein T02_9399 [Trichinella nativa]|uniref:Uncharacterized protein n=1 Tax=Trichinella nativa TaxID=6335 RepID=A0A0V1KJX6_9BILA|nr:hypothetical protein T02_9399 [Trichinella nativa]